MERSRTVGIVASVCAGVVVVGSFFRTFGTGLRRAFNDVVLVHNRELREQNDRLRRIAEIADSQVEDLKKIIELNDGRIKDLKKLIEIRGSQVEYLSAENHGLKMDNEKLREWYAKSRNYSSLLEEVRNEINKRAKPDKWDEGEGWQPCWNFDETIKCLVKYRPNVGTEQNDETMITLEGRIKKLETCKQRLEDMVRIVRDEVSTINCEKARELIDVMKEARNNLFAACVEGYEAGMMGDLRLRNVVGYLSNSELHSIREEEIKVEDSSSPDDAIRLQKELNEVLGCLDDDGYKAWTYIRKRRSEAEVELYKMIGEIADCFREE